MRQENFKLLATFQLFAMMAFAIGGIYEWNRAEILADKQKAEGEIIKGFTVAHSDNGRPNLLVTCEDKSKLPAMWHDLGAQTIVIECEAREGQ